MNNVIDIQDKLKIKKLLSYCDELELQYFYNDGTLCISMNLLADKYKDFVKGDEERDIEADLISQVRAIDEVIHVGYFAGQKEN